MVTSKSSSCRVLSIALASFNGLRSRPAYSYSELPITSACLVLELESEVAGRITRDCDQASGPMSMLTRRNHGSGLVIIEIPVLDDVTLRSLLNFVNSFRSEYYGVRAC